MRMGEFCVFAVVAGTVATLFEGYFYGLHDQIELIPQVLRHLDPTYLANDFLVNTSVEFGPRHYYSKLLAAASRVCPLPFVCLGLTFACNVLIALVTCLFALQLFGGSALAAMMACTLVMAVRSFDLGLACIIRRSYLIPQLMAMPLALAALWAALRCRPLTCAVLSVAASLVQPLVGLEVGAIGVATAGIASLLRLDRNERLGQGKALAALGRSALAGMVVILFGVFVWVIPLRGERIATSEFMRILAYFRAPHHYIPSTFPPLAYAAFACCMVAFGLSWKWWHDDPSTDKALARRALIPVLIVLGLCVGGYVFVEVFPTRLWTTAQTFRLLLIPKWLGLMIVGRTVACFLERAEPGGQHCMGWLLIAGSKAAQPFVLALAHAAEVARARFANAGASRCAYATIGMAVLAAAGLQTRLGGERESGTLLALAALAMWFWLLPRRWYRPVVPVVLTALLVLLIIIDRRHAIPIVAKCMAFVRPVVTLDDHDGDGPEIARMARARLPEDAVVLTPPGFGLFRLHGRRAIVVDFKAYAFQDRAMAEWKARMVDCYGEPQGGGFGALEQMDRSYKAIARDRLKSVASKYGALYAVLYRDTPCDFPVLCENATYKTVALAADGKSEKDR